MCGRGGRRRRKDQERGVEKKKKEDQTNGQTNKETVRVNSDEGWYHGQIGEDLRIKDNERLMHVNNKVRIR